MLLITCDRLYYSRFTIYYSPLPHIEKTAEKGASIRAILTFLCLLIAALFAGALLAWPLYRALAPAGVEFDTAVIHATQLCGLAFALLYLGSARPLSWRVLGLAPAGRGGLARLLGGFGWGVVILAGLVAALAALGIQQPVPGRDTGAAAIGLLCVKAVLTGLAVGLFEETLFRGALLEGLRLRAGAAAALVTVSLVYAAVHFIDFPATAEPGWLTAALQFPGAYLAIFRPANGDAFLALFMLGTLLGLMRLRGGDILGCIGLHAGLVAMIKVSRYFYRYRPGSPFDFLVGAHDHRLGYLALLILAAATLAYTLWNRPPVRTSDP